MSDQRIFPHQLTKNVKFLQKATIIVNGQVLILRRTLNSKSRLGCWDLPGGNCEWPVKNQTSTANLHLQDIAREVKEETGLIVSVSAFIFDQLVYLSSYFDSSKQIYTVITGWRITANMLQKSVLQKKQQNSAEKNSSQTVSNQSSLKQSQTTLINSLPPIQLSSEHTEYAWIKPTDLTNYDFGGEKGSFLVDIIERGFATSLNRPPTFFGQF